LCQSQFAKPRHVLANGNSVGGDILDGACSIFLFQALPLGSRHLLG
jgi:hypothetical protein